MKAVVAHEFSGPSGLVYAEVEDPAGEGDVVIDVAAAGVCFPDLLLIRGEYQWKPPLPFIPGNEVAGTVLSAPPQSGFVAGQRVSACPMLGGYAERVAVPSEFVVASPAHLDDAAAACLLGNYYTAYFALAQRGRLRPGETVLVLGAAGGIGTASAQVAKALGARVIALVNRPQAVDFAESVGADVVLPLVDGWTRRVRDCTGGGGVDVVIDQVGGAVFADALGVLAPEGRLLVLGFASGGGIPGLRIPDLLPRNTSVVGVNSYDYVARTPDGRAQLQRGVARLVEAGMRPPPPVLVRLSDAGSALERLAAGEVIGKAVLVP
ncbi:MAG: NADPH:quinone oxidoreductase family protein [Mycolicibacterium cosmeticum]|nr:NADPH:quinone oxidoreductase family protein [Mycolicibacterium cosmeticum]